MQKFLLLKYFWTFYVILYDKRNSKKKKGKLAYSYGRTSFMPMKKRAVTAKIKNILQTIVTKYIISSTRVFFVDKKKNPNERNIQGNK